MPNRSSRKREEQFRLLGRFRSTSDAVDGRWRDATVFRGLTEKGQPVIADSYSKTNLAEYAIDAGQSSAISTGRPNAAYVCNVKCRKHIWAIPSAKF